MTGLVIGTFLVQRGADLITGELTATIIAGVALGAVATTLSRSPTRPARLLLFLGGFFVLTVGALGLRGLAEVIAGQSDAGVRDLLNLLLLVPTVSFGLMLGYLIAPRRLPAWLSPMRKRALAGRPTTDEISRRGWDDVRTTVWKLSVGYSSACSSSTSRTLVGCTCNR